MPQFSLFSDNAQNNPSTRPTSAGVSRTKKSGGKSRPQSASAARGGGESVGMSIAKQDTRNKGRSAALKAMYGDLADQKVSVNHMSREALLLELQESKKKNKLLETQASQIKAENQRLQGEVNKQQQRIDRLMDPSVAAKSGFSASGTRKEVEKSLLVRHLKHQIILLRSTIASKDKELEMQKRSVKMSNITELLTEREEYFFECQRLRNVVKEMKVQMTDLKRGKRGTGEGKLLNEDIENELRREVAKLASGYQDVLHSMRDRDKHAWKAELNQPSANPQVTAMNNKSNNINNSINVNMGAPAIMNDNTMDTDIFDNGASSTAIAEIPPFNPKAKVRPQLEVRGGNLPSKKADTTPTTPTVETNRLPYKIGDRVEGRFQKGDKYYKATVKYITGPTTLHLLYDDGDEERNVELSLVRVIEGGDKKMPAPLAMSPSKETTATKADTTKEMVASCGKFQKKEEVEALFSNGERWYRATVTEVHVRGNVHTYDLHYFDGDREMKVAESKIRKYDNPILKDLSNTSANNTNGNATKAMKIPPPLKKQGTDTSVVSGSASSSAGGWSSFANLFRDKALELIGAQNYENYKLVFSKLVKGNEKQKHHGGSHITNNTVADIQEFRKFVEDIMDQRYESSHVTKSLYMEISKDKDMTYKIFSEYLDYPHKKQETLYTDIEGDKENSHQHHRVYKDYQQKQKVEDGEVVAALEAQKNAEAAEHLEQENAIKKAKKQEEQELIALAMKKNMYQKQKEEEEQAARDKVELEKKREEEEEEEEERKRKEKEEEDELERQQYMKQQLEEKAAREEVEREGEEKRKEREHLHREKEKEILRLKQEREEADRIQREKEAHAKRQEDQAAVLLEEARLLREKNEREEEKLRQEMMRHQISTNNNAADTRTDSERQYLQATMFGDPEDSVEDNTITSSKRDLINPDLSPGNSILSERFPNSALSSARGPNPNGNGGYINDDFEGGMDAGGDYGATRELKAEHLYANQQQSNNQFSHDRRGGSQSAPSADGMATYATPSEAGVTIADTLADPSIDGYDDDFEP